jgi:hypothetical protein
MPGSATGGEEVRDAVGNDVPGARDAAQRRPDPLRPCRRLTNDHHRAPVSSWPPPSAPSTQLGFPAYVCAQQRKTPRAIGSSLIQRLGFLDTPLGYIRH